MVLVSMAHLVFKVMRKILEIRRCQHRPKNRENTNLICEKTPVMYGLPIS